MVSGTKMINVKVDRNMNIYEDSGKNGERLIRISHKYIGTRRGVRTDKRINSKKSHRIGYLGL